MIEALREEHRKESERHEPRELLAVRREVRVEVAEADGAEEEVAEEPGRNQEQPWDRAPAAAQEQQHAEGGSDHQAGDPCQGGERSGDRGTADLRALEEEHGRERAGDVDRLGGAGRAIEQPSRRQEQEDEREEAWRFELPDVAREPVEEQDRRRRGENRDEQKRAFVSEERETPYEQRIERHVGREEARFVNVGQQRVVGSDLVQRPGHGKEVGPVPEPVHRRHVPEKRPVHQKGPAHRRERQPELRPHAGSPCRVSRGHLSDRILRPEAVFSRSQS